MKKLLLFFFVFPLFLVAQEDQMRQHIVLEILAPDKEKIEKNSKLEIGFEVPNDLLKGINNFINDRYQGPRWWINPFLDRKSVV